MRQHRTLSLPSQNAKSNRNKGETPCPLQVKRPLRRR